MAPSLFLSLTALACLVSAGPVIIEDHANAYLLCVTSRPRRARPLLPSVARRAPALAALPPPRPPPDCPPRRPLRRHMLRPLGVSNGCVPDAAMTASDTKPSSDGDFGAYRGRVNKSAEAGLHGGWRPSQDDKSPWVQVDLGAVHEVTGIVTQGGFALGDGVFVGGTAAWVSSYKATFSVDNKDWFYIDDAISLKGEGA